MRYLITILFLLTFSSCDIAHRTLIHNQTRSAINAYVIHSDTSYYPNWMHIDSLPVITKTNNTTKSYMSAEYLSDTSYKITIPAYTSIQLYPISLGDVIREVFLYKDGDTTLKYNSTDRKNIKNLKRSEQLERNIFRTILYQKFNPACNACPPML